MKKPLAALFLLLFVASSKGDDLTTLDGKKYVGVTISRVEPDGIMVTTDDGISKIPFTNLPPEIRAKYGYDPERAATFAREVATAQRDHAHHVQEIMEQQTAATRAAAQDETKHKEEKVIAQPGTGLIVKPGVLTVDAIVESPFTLRGYAVEVSGIDRTDKQEVAAGVYKVTMWGYDTHALEAEMSAAQCESAARSKHFYIRVKDQEKYSSITVPGVIESGSKVRGEQ